MLHFPATEWIRLWIPTGYKGQLATVYVTRLKDCTWCPQDRRSLLTQKLSDGVGLRKINRRQQKIATGPGVAAGSGLQLDRYFRCRSSNAGLRSLQVSDAEGQRLRHDCTEARSDCRPDVTETQFPADRTTTPCMRQGVVDKRPSAEPESLLRKVL